LARRTAVRPSSGTFGRAAGAARVALSQQTGIAPNRCSAPVREQAGRKNLFISDLLRFASADLAIDLGTANTVVYLRDRGVVLAEPSIVALETNNGITTVRAVGDDAKLMLGKTPENLRTVRPLRNGVIADLEVAEHMIKHFVTKARAKL